MELFVPAHEFNYGEIRIFGWFLFFFINKPFYFNIEGKCNARIFLSPLLRKQHSPFHRNYATLLRAHDVLHNHAQTLSPPRANQRNRKIVEYNVRSSNMVQRHDLIKWLKEEEEKRVDGATVVVINISEKEFFSFFFTQGSERGWRRNEEETRSERSFVRCSRGGGLSI